MLFQVYDCRVKKRIFLKRPCFINIVLKKTIFIKKARAIFKEAKQLVTTKVTQSS